MTEPYPPTRRQCWLCGFTITSLHDPFALRVTFTNLHRDPDAPTTLWQETYAHAECIAERMPAGACFDAEMLAEDADPDENVLDNGPDGG